MSYKDFEISNGADAAAHFTRIARGEYTKTKIKQIKADLLKYCKQDTLAMVKLHEKLYEIASKAKAK